MEKKLAALIPLVALGGCLGLWGDEEEVPSPARPVQIDSVTFEMAAEANGRRPARVALVQVENANLVEQLFSIPAAEWFGEQGRSFRAAHPNAYYDDWELVPGLVTGPFNLKVDEDVTAVLFCHTDAATPPLRIEEAGDGDIAVHIEPSGCEVHPIE